MKKIIPDFKNPSDLPKTETERKSWQNENYSWWESHPMRYDWKNKIEGEEFSLEFFTEIDRRFFENAKEYLPKENIPFDSLIHFAFLSDKDVLEIGVGNGSHAAIFSKYTKSFTGIDITDYAVKSTGERFKKFGLNGKLMKMDAEHMDFADQSFDFVWSWGVIHHSANTEKIISEIKRILRPNGRAIIMVYHRGWWNYYFLGFLRALIKGDIFKTKSLHQSIQIYTDGAIARYYSFGDWKKMVSKYFQSVRIESLGPRTDVLPLPLFLKEIIYPIFPKSINRFLTHKLRMGSFLISVLQK